MAVPIEPAGTPSQYAEHPRSWAEEAPEREDHEDHEVASHAEHAAVPDPWEPWEGSALEEARYVAVPVPWGAQEAVPGAAEEVEGVGPGADVEAEGVGPGAYVEAEACERSPERRGGPQEHAHVAQTVPR